jgi:hypothetical protein
MRYHTLPLQRLVQVKTVQTQGWKLSLSAMS